ncbi:MAG: translation elongation factor Ts [bacterium]
MANVSMEMVKELREKTQIGMMDCKKALEESNGDMEKAIDILRKKGAAIASKRADYATNNGRIEAYIDQNAQSGALIQVGCETDFSANTAAMQDFCLNIAKGALETKETNPEALEAKLPELKKQHDEILAKIAEKIHINKIAVLTVQTHGLINYYIHPGSQVGIIIELATEHDASKNIDELKAIARNVCMHIAVRNPLAVQPQDLDPALIAKEREIALDQLKDSKKPANILDKIIDGKINKYYSDVCLINQLYIKNEDQTIEQYIKEESGKIKNTITIKRFSHFIVGQAK